MRLSISLLAAGAASLTLIVGSAGAAFAQTAFRDSICPQAASYVTAAGKLRRDDPPQHVYDAAQAAVNAYEECSKEKLANGYREPQHYADTRAAGLAVVASRALIAMDRTDDARRELHHWRELAQQVVDWQDESTAFASADVNGSASTTGSDHRGSLYRASAKEIVSAIDDELKTIGSDSRNVDRRQETAPSPVPAPH